MEAASFIVQLTSSLRLAGPSVSVTVYLTAGLCLVAFCFYNMSGDAPLGSFLLTVSLPNGVVFGPTSNIVGEFLLWLSRLGT